MLEEVDKRQGAYIMQQASSGSSYFLRGTILTAAAKRRGFEQKVYTDVCILKYKAVWPTHQSYTEVADRQKPSAQLKHFREKVNRLCDT